MKIAVVSLNLTAFDAILLRMKQRGHTVRFWKRTKDQVRNFVELGRLCEWADLIWCEFCQHPVEGVLRMFPMRKIVVTLRRIEMYNQIYTLNWVAVDLLIFSCNHVKRRFYDYLEKSNFERKTPANLPQRDYVFQSSIYDGEIFKWVPRKLDPPYNLCIVGHIVPKKRVYTLVQMFADLPDHYCLNILGKHIHKTGYGNPEYLHNIEDLIETLDLGERVIFHGWRDRKKVTDFFSEQHIIVCNSNEESRARILAEAMACGVYPLISHFRGAEELYPKKHIYDTPVGFVEKVLEWEALSPEEKLEESKKLSKFVSTTVQEAKAYVEEMERIIVRRSEPNRRKL